MREPHFLSAELQKCFHAFFQNTIFAPHGLGFLESKIILTDQELAQNVELNIYTNVASIRLTFTLALLFLK